MKLINSIKSNWVIILILVLAAFLRFWRLDVNPPHLTPDEAALGYNAYSILKTGRDEYGELMPIVFKSFGDFKPGFYIYASLPFIASMGLNEFSVRSASALGGVFAVWLVYLIVLRLFKSEIGINIRSSNPNRVATVSALLLAISPWHIHFSRGAWEVNLALTFILAGIYFFLLSIKNNWFLLISSIFFGISLITYQGAKMSAIIVLIILFALYWKDFILYNRKVLVVSFLLGLLISLPIFMSFTSGQTGRLKIFSVFSYRRPDEYLNQLISLGKTEFGSVKYYLYYSETENTIRGISGRWFNHYSPRFLLFEGDWQNPRHSSPDHGVLLLVDIIFFVIGIGILTKLWKHKVSKFVLLWLLFAPLPAALSRDQIHAVRALNLVVPMVITVAFGLTSTTDWLGTKKLKGSLVNVGIFAFYLLSVIYFLDSYFVHQPIHNSQYWEYGYKQVVERVTPIQNDYDIVHVRQSYAQPYIYFLFYQKYDPEKYQSQAELIESEYGDVGRVEVLDNIRFWPIDWSVNRGDFGTLFVADPIRIPPEDSMDPGEFKIIDEIKYLDGKQMAFRIIEILDEENVNKSHD